MILQLVVIAVVYAFGVRVVVDVLKN